MKGQKIKFEAAVNSVKVELVGVIKDSVRVSVMYALTTSANYTKYVVSEHDTNKAYVITPSAIIQFLDNDD